MLYVMNRGWESHSGYAFEEHQKVWEMNFPDGAVLFKHENSFVWKYFILSPLFDMNVERNQSSFL